MPHAQRISYVIDASDEIISVSGDWDRFALANDCPSEFFSQVIIPRQFWSFISGDVLSHVYRNMLVNVRAGTPFGFDFRCDSPELRRFLRMQVSPADDGGVEFRTETNRIEEREPQILFDAHAERTGEIVVACSWCNRIQTGLNVWQEVEDAVRTLGLFENQSMPSLSHGMCNKCYEEVMGTLGAR